MTWTIQNQTDEIIYITPLVRTPGEHQLVPSFRGGPFSPPTLWKYDIPIEPGSSIWLVWQYDKYIPKLNPLIRDSQGNLHQLGEEAARDANPIVIDDVSHLSPADPSLIPWTKGVRFNTEVVTLPLLLAPWITFPVLLLAYWRRKCRQRLSLRSGPSASPNV
jgi:hypothetical protein